MVSNRPSSSSSNSAGANAAGVRNPRASLWMMVAGIAVVALQLLAFDRVLERHVEHAQVQAANYVTVTLQPRTAAVAAAAPEVLMAAN